MAIRTRFTPFDRAAVLRAAKGETPEQQSKRHAAFARGALADAQAINKRALGVVPPHETYVDGRAGAAPESVKPGGVIVFEFDLYDDMFEWIGNMLLEHAPVRSGRYAQSFAFFADGVEVAPGAALPQAGEYVFINTQPYARKIERGLSPQAPDGVFEAVAAMARARYGNVASIKFSYRSLQDGSIVDYVGTGTGLARNRLGGKSGRRGRFAATAIAGAEAHQREWETRQPSIVIAR